MMEVALMFFVHVKQIYIKYMVGMEVMGVME